MTLTALLARCEVWPANEQYPARHLLHLVLDSGEFLSLTTTAEVWEQARQLPPMTRCALILAVERTYRDGRLRLRAESVSRPAPAVKAGA